MNTINVEFSFHLPMKITKKRKWFLASCPILDVHSQGETEKKARDNLRDALRLFFVSCFERGTLEAVLKECGFRVIHQPDRPRKKKLEPDQEYIKVPIPFYIDQTGPACHA